MRNDRNIRDYFIQPRISSIAKTEEFRTMTEIMNSGKYLADLSLFKFETAEVSGLTQNTFNDFIAYLTDNPGNTQVIEFDHNAALRFEYKSWSICKWLYGNSELYYLIFALNDIEHDADLSYDYLRTHPIRVPAGPGLEALQRLLTFKERIETSEGNGSFYVDEM